MYRVLLRIFTFVFISLLVTPGTFAKEELPSVSGRAVARIVEQFIEKHYSQRPLDDEISKRVFKLYINRLDPGHYYFLQSDIDEFQKQELKLDDLLRKGDVEFALHVFTRFKTRLQERLDMMESITKETFDFQKDETWIIDRKDLPSPKNKAEAFDTWRRKVKFDLLTLTLGESTIDEAKERLLKRFRSAVKEYSQYPENDVVALYINALTSAYDPHSSYLAPRELSDFNINIKLSLEGIGAVLRWEDGYTVISSVVPGGAAFREGSLKTNDRIISVAQGDQPFESVIDMRLTDVVDLIRGNRGTKVRLQVLRKGEHGYDTLSVGITRDKVVLKDREAKSVLIQPASANALTKQSSAEIQSKSFRIGVIQLPSFYIDFNQRRESPYSYKSSSRDVQKHLKHFNRVGVDGLILDLRDNGGGGLDEAISMSGLFVGREPIVMVRQSTGTSRIHRSAQRTVYEGPLLVLVNRSSASASEIFVGAMQDYGRAILIGDRTTFGKGTVQNVENLPEGYGALKITVAQFYRVSGGSTQNKGVESDILWPSMSDEWEFGEDTLEYALPWKQIPAADYQKQGNLSLYIPSLQKKSAERIKSSDDFQRVERDIQEYVTKIKPRKSVTILNLQSDFKEKEAERQKLKQAAAIGEKTGDEKSHLGKNTSAVEGDGAKEVQETEELVIPKDDFYFRESVSIMEDYLQLLRQTNPKETTPPKQ